MQIKPSDILSVENAGTMNGSPVKIIKTKGGFHLAIGKIKGKFKEEALAAGSHPAIVKFNLQKQFPEFEPVMMKSEGFVESIVEKHSHFLSDELRKSGHDIYSIQTGSNIEFTVTKQGLTIANTEATVQGGSLVFKNLSMDKRFVQGLAGATTEKAISCGANKVRIED